MTDEYYTVSGYATAQNKEKGSKFIGHIFPVKSTEEAGRKISDTKKKFYDATHNCSAYLLGLGDEAIYHFDDDGEPSGTAGQPIYQAITGAGITDVLIVVTRYFGGTKLGTGGLIRAYGHTARITIENAERMKKIRTETLAIHTTYDDISQVMRTIDLASARIVSQDYGEEIRMEIAVRQSQVDDFQAQLVENTGGRIAFV
mgnify:CR=1 FL=1